MRALDEALILAACVGFAMTREGFNGQCAFSGLEPSDRQFRYQLATIRPEEVEEVRRALRLAGLLR